MAAGKGSKGKKRSAGKRPSPSSSRAKAAPPRPAPPPTPSPAPSKPTRDQRLDAARRARKRKALLVRVGVVATVALLAGVVAAVVAADRRATSKERNRLTAGSCTFDTRNDPLSRPPNNHVAPPSYRVDPPSGGNHALQDAPAGVYGDGNEPPPPDSRLVHSLEHGYVVLWHRPGLDQKDMDAIRGVFDRYSQDVLVVPRPSLTVKVAATSWGKRLLCREVEPNRLAEFVRLYRNESPEPRD